MPALVAVLIQQMPEIIAFGKAAFAHAHPDEPVPTDAEVVAAWLQASASTLTKDANWLAQHPEAGDGA